MAKIIESKVDSRTVSQSYSIWRTALLGMVLGVIFWILTAIISRYSNSIQITGDVATILVATIGIIVMVRQRASRPLLVTIAAAVSLWGLALWTEGLVWGETLAWSVLLYALAYILFSWIVRYARIIPVTIIALIIVVFVRIFVGL